MEKNQETKKEKETEKNPRKIKTYAARGLLDWQMALNVGGAILRICFSGGTMGSNGVVPARYTTENEAIQRIIETTDYFKKGRIILLRQEIIKDEKSEKKDTTKTHSNGKN